MIEPFSERKLHPILVLSVVAVVSLISALLIYALLQENVHNNEMYNLVMEKIHLTGVSNPVTAVLLSFRVYDTLLEFAVLFCVSIACLPYLKLNKINIQHIKIAHSQLFTLVKALVPLVILLSGYMLWVGSFKPGGAFQAGALLTGAGLLLSLLNIEFTKTRSLFWRLLFSLSLIFFLIAICYGYFATSTFLLFPSELSGGIILFIEFAATLSIAATLYLCYLSVRGRKEREVGDAS